MFRGTPDKKEPRSTAAKDNPEPSGEKTLLRRKKDRVAHEITPPRRRVHS